MRAFRNLLIGLAALVVLLIGGAWLVPPLLDWNRYRDEIAQLASQTLDQTVRIDGPITLALLPQPELTAARISVAAAPGRAAISAAQLRLRVALGPLLSGRVDARELVLKDADIRLPWPLEPTAMIVRAPSWLAALSARLENGRITVGELAATGIDATLTTSDATGSVLTAGTAQVAGRTWRFTLRATRPGGDGAAGIDLSLDGQGPLTGTGAALTGQIQADGSLLGRISGRGADLSKLLAAPAVPFRAEGRVSVAAGLAAADQLVGEIAGSPAQGTVALRLSPSPRLDVALTASRLDLDAWAPALLRAVQAGTMPAMPTGIDLSAEAARLGGGTLRGLRAAFDLDRGAVVLREARAVLPGEAALRLDGRIGAAAPGTAQFEGQAALSAPDLRTTLAWAEAAGVVPQADLPPGVLRSADVTAHATAGAAGLALTDLAGRLDGAGVQGSLALRAAPSRGLRAALSVDRLELDPWLPRVAGDVPAALASLAGLPGSFAFDLHLTAAQALVHGVTLQPLLLEAATEDGRLVLRRLDLQALGAQVGASMTLLDGGRIADAKLDIQAPHAAPLAALLPVGLAAWTERLPVLLDAPLSLQVQVSNRGAALSGRVAAQLGDLRVEAEPSLDLRSGRWAGPVTLHHPGAPRLAELLGLGPSRSWLGDGSLGLVARITADADRIAADSFDLSAGLLHATGTLAVALGPTPALTGHISADTLPLPYPAGSAPLAVQALAGWRASVQLDAAQVLAGQAPTLEQATALLTLADGTLRIAGLAARLGGGTLKAGLRLDAAATPPALAVEGSLTDAVLTAPLFGTPFDLAGGTVDASASFTATGYAPAAMLASLDGELRLHAHDGTVTGVALGRAAGDLAEADITAALAGGSTAFTDLDAELHFDRGGGHFLRGGLTGPDGAVSIAGGIDLPGDALNLRLVLRPNVPEPPEIGLRVTGPADAPERLPELGDVIRWRAAHVQ